MRLKSSDSLPFHRAVVLFKIETTSGWVHWCMPIISPTWEVEIGGSQSESGLDKSGRSYVKNKLKAKGLGAWLM
jgi:hypothetical protein